MAFVMQSRALTQSSVARRASRPQQAAAYSHVTSRPTFRHPSVVAQAGKVRSATPLHAAQTLSSLRGRATVLQASLRASCAWAVCAQVQKISGEQLEVEISGRDKPIIVDFFAT